MSDSKTVYNTMIDAGISSEDAREFCLSHLGDDPIALDGAVVRIVVEVQVSLDYSELDGIDVDDDLAILDIANEKVMTEISSTYGDVEIVGVTDSDICEKSLDNGELV